MHQNGNLNAFLWTWQRMGFWTKTLIFQTFVNLGHPNAPVRTGRPQLLIIKWKRILDVQLRPVQLHHFESIKRTNLKVKNRRYSTTFYYLLILFPVRHGWNDRGYNIILVPYHIICLCRIVTPTIWVEICNILNESLL